ncbi:hypothetical protein K2173_006100 [Erythroxylum novogranatense]|uniref:chitinase n=1 Tax=Erythroxylum novogranatense TaxID=1862640 RepID=A0AAV8TDP7_9ROSI|nr:hypothetical protein K2173_006100 [Erythroxylum novogranatense]
MMNSLVLFTLALLLGTSAAEQCGRQAGNALCPNSLCCSQHGWCGSTDQYCGNGCQSQCRPGGSTTTPSGGDVGSIITQNIFNQLLKYSNDGRCQSNGFYRYDAFITAARSFGGFGTTGDVNTRKRELAAFLGQTSHETTDGPYAWGYCFVRENNRLTYCTSNQWPCPAGRQYYGRGPIQLTHHSVIVGQWSPSDADRSANRVPGYGVITNIINGGLECGHGRDDRVENRIGFYKRYCDILGLSYGNNLDCNSQRPFA